MDTVLSHVSQAAWAYNWNMHDEAIAQPNAVLRRLSKTALLHCPKLGKHFMPTF